MGCRIKSPAPYCKRQLFSLRQIYAGLVLSIVYKGGFMSENKNSNNMLIWGGAVICVIIALLLVLMFAPEEGSAPPVSKTNLNEEKYEQQMLLAPVTGFSRYKFKFTYDFKVKGHIADFTFKLPIPQDEKERQRISNLKIHPKPSKIIDSETGKTAVFEMSNIKAGNFKIEMEGEADIRTYNIRTAQKLNRKLSNENSLKRYLKSERGIESDDAYIKNIAEKLKGASKKETVKNVYKYLQQNMTYRIIGENLSAKEALKRKYGKCTEFSAAMTALLRALNIPSRVVTGSIARSENTPHNWVEVYYDEYGWVTYDPAVEPVKVNIYAPDRTLAGTELMYETSHDEIQYIKSAVNTFDPYTASYSFDSENYGDMDVRRSENIKKIQG